MWVMIIFFLPSEKQYCSFSSPLLYSIFSWTFPSCFLSESLIWLLNNDKKILSSAQPNWYYCPKYWYHFFSLLLCQMDCPLSTIPIQVYNWIISIVNLYYTAYAKVILRLWTCTFYFHRNRPVKMFMWWSSVLLLGCILLGADGWPVKEGYNFRSYQPLVRLRHKVWTTL